VFVLLETFLQMLVVWVMVKVDPLPAVALLEA
jgi:hypothetical protein